MKYLFFLSLFFLASNFTYAGDENTRYSTLDSQDNYRQAQQDSADLTELNHRVDEYRAKIYETTGMITGALTGAGTMFIMAVSLKGLLHPVAATVLCVSMLPIQMGIGAYIGNRCKQ